MMRRMRHNWMPIVMLLTLATVPAAWAQQPAEPPAVDDAAAEPEAEATPADAATAAAPTTMTIGLTMKQIGKLDIGQGTFTADFWITVSCDREPCAPDFEVVN